jgi:hypothetical protein
MFQITNGQPSCSYPPSFSSRATQFVKTTQLDLGSRPVSNRRVAYEKSCIGEIGLTGCASALTMATYHSTGVRVRELPIRIEKLMAGPDERAA